MSDTHDLIGRTVSRLRERARYGEGTTLLPDEVLAIVAEVDARIMASQRHLTEGERYEAFKKAMAIEFAAHQAEVSRLTAALAAAEAKLANVEPAGCVELLHDANMTMAELRNDLAASEAFAVEAERLLASIESGEHTVSLEAFTRFCTKVRACLALRNGNAAPKGVNPDDTETLDAILAENAHLKAFADAASTQLASLRHSSNGWPLLTASGKCECKQCLAIDACLALLDTEGKGG